jgi:hypothetical protein
MIDLQEVELLVEAGKLRNAELLAFTLNDKQSSGYIDIYTLTLFAKKILELDVIFHDEEITTNDARRVRRNLVKWVNSHANESDEWWAVGLVRLVDPEHPTVRHYDEHGLDSDKKGELVFRAAYAAIRQKLNGPSRE